MVALVPGDLPVSRTRLIRPEFFADERMASLSDSTRLVYIGLWTLCDDAGYFERKPRQIAAELFRYETPRHREHRVDRAMTELADLGRLRYLACGEHGIVPTIPDHRIKGGEALFTIQKRHVRRCSVGPTEDSVRAMSDSVSVSVSESVSVSDSVSQEAAPPKRRSLRDVSLEVGGFAATLARKPA